MIVYVTVRQNFNAGHRLHNPKLSDDDNRKLYGKCNNPSGHGHNYVLEVTLKGDVDPEVGAFVNADEVRKWLWRDVLEEIDHHNLNSDVGFMRGIIPTSENLARVLFEQLRTGEFGQYLDEVRVYESDNNSAAFRAE